MDSHTETPWETDRCTHEGEEGRCLAVGVGAGQRCFVHGTDAEREHLLSEFEDGADLTFTRGLTVDSELLDLIISRAPFNEEERRILRNADFSFARFTDVVSPSGVTFEGLASFEGANFVFPVMFSEIDFRGEAYFSRSTFRSNAFFDEVVFSGNATFENAEFGRWTAFYNVTFVEGLALYGSTFRDAFSVDGCRFTGAAHIGPFKVIGPASFSETVFEGPVVFEFAGREFWCVASSFRASASFAIRRAFVLLQHTVFAAPAQLSAPSAPFARSVRDPAYERGPFSEDGLAPVGADERPILASLWLQDARHLTILGFNLSVCRFATAPNLELIRIDGTAGFSWDERESRKVLVDELMWRSRRDGDDEWAPVILLAPHRRWFEVPDNSEEYTDADTRFREDFERWSHRLNETLYDADPLPPTIIAGTYRSLRRSFEDAGNAPGAADFYYGEMEMRRRDLNTPVGERILIWLYWLVSGYGLRGMRTVISLASSVLVFSLAFFFWGFEGEVPFAQSLLFAANSTTSLFHRIDQSLTLVGQTMDMALRLIGPLLFGLLVLSLRNRVRR